MQSFNVDNELTQNIEDLLASGRGNSKRYGSSQERYGLYGYPTLHHSDFFLDPLRNIHHPQIMSGEYRQNFCKLGDRLINDDILLPLAANMRKKAKILADSN